MTDKFTLIRGILDPRLFFLAAALVLTGCQPPYCGVWKAQDSEFPRVTIKKVKGTAYVVLTEGRIADGAYFITFTGNCGEVSGDEKGGWTISGTLKGVSEMQGQPMVIIHIDGNGKSGHVVWHQQDFKLKPE